jgi:DNA-binding NarL/FixJ family response regulator
MKQSPIRLVLADNSPVMLLGLRQALTQEPDFEIAAECTDGATTLKTVRELQPDILVMDLSLPGTGGLSILRKMRDEKIPTRPVIFTAALDGSVTAQVLHLGVRGVVLKDMAPHFLVRCIRKVHTNSKWLEKESFTRALDLILHREAELQEVTLVLTPREIEVTRMVAGGLHNKQIARKLSVAEGTVKTHLHKIYSKLKLDGRHALTLFAQSKALI